MPAFRCEPRVVAQVAIFDLLGANYGDIVALLGLLSRERVNV